MEIKKGILGTYMFVVPAGFIMALGLLYPLVMAFQLSFFDWSMGMPWESFAAGENSDHTYFEQVGVPAAFITQRDDPYYHTPEDTPDKIQVATLEANGELATAVMYDWAKNPVLREKKDVKVKKVHVYRDRVYNGK